MECKKCGNILPENAKFCFECGAKVEQDLICTACGAKMSLGYKFCIECGSVISGSDENLIEKEVTETSGLEIEEIDWDNLLIPIISEEDDMHQKISRLKITDENRYFSKEEAKQLIRDFLEIVDWKEVRDLGGGRYIVKVPMSDEFRQKYFVLNAILNMNNVEAFAKGYSCLYDCFYDELIYNTELIIDMMFNLNILTPIHGRYDWMSSCVDGNIFSFKTRYGEKESSIFSYDDKKESRYREYEELSIINVTTGEEQSIKAYIRIHNCQESVCRIVINLAEHYAKYAEKEGFSFYIFDADGKVILKKRGQHTYRCGNKRFAELLYHEKACNGKFKQIGLYDEITGNEIVPIQYDYVSAWKKNDGSILAIGVPEILDCKKEIDYYEYDLGGESQVVRRQNIYPTSAEVCDESINNVTNKRGINIWVLEDKLKSMGYEEIELICI